jgi:Flp pilus assembly pilin Flp
MPGVYDICNRGECRFAIGNQNHGYCISRSTVVFNDCNLEREMKQLIAKFWKEESGAQMAEYALLLVLIGMIVAVAALYLSGQIKVAFNAVASCIAGAANGSTDACPPAS